ncbi:hypothetical protein JMM81_08775 [Bacillus sp. V3B]|uniref:hypothetical protein n=1 Tax=Bacillus sp. V3B TaxID=2804915 RepID=UPI0021098371|nr:hypothetical protein [Bacillus sp. V3B]MCQ6275053.1 hypothetical protein [Bacillus sp. V3B]
MSLSEQTTNEKNPFYKLWPMYIVLVLLLVIIGLYFYSQSLIRIETPKKELGDKVIITLPAGKTIFTYENFIVEEDGKLLYKGERNTIDLTGGDIVYENWE